MNMVVDSNISPYIVHSDDSVQYALEKINQNGKRIVYCISADGILEGVFADGDFRRWVVSLSDPDLNLPVNRVSNKKYVSANYLDPIDSIKLLLSAKVSSIPLLDNVGRLLAIAWSDEVGIRLGEKIIATDKPTFIIAEIGNNHNGSLSLAKKLIERAADSGADCAKFQLRDMNSLYDESSQASSEDLGSEYTLDLLDRFQLSQSEMLEALAYVKECGMTPLCTPWDLVSLRFLDKNGLQAFKISSADLTNLELLTEAAKTKKPLIISTGMSTEDEIISAVNLMKRELAAFVLLHCNSTYPAPMSDINLTYINRLQKICNSIVGYSGHERGWEVCVAAVAMGAKVIEKHFTLDKTMEGNDHRVSLLPEEFKEMVKAIRNVELAMGSNIARTISQGELLNREVLAKSIVAARDIKEGELILKDAVSIKSPGRGLQPYRITDLIGVRSARNIKKGEVFYETDISGVNFYPRAYQFTRPWGIPVRYYDLNALTKNAPVDFVEIHFSYRDLDINPFDCFKQNHNFGYVVHSPELFSGDHVMDLSSRDPAYRKRSIAELKRVINRTKELKQFFNQKNNPKIVINAGGFSADEFISKESRKLLYSTIAESLNELDLNGVEIIPQTMPPFPWHFGGQRYHNLFVDPLEIVDFCKSTGVRVCLDISHSQLACNYYGWSLDDFIETIGDFVSHLHIVDARGNYDEGLQIGSGEIDFKLLMKNLDKFCPGVPFIPEIWQGHKNNGEGFWIALHRLELCQIELSEIKNV